MITQEYHVAYFIAPNLLSGVNVLAQDEMQAMAEAYELVKFPGNWNVCYVYAKETKTLNMMDFNLKFIPIPEDFFYEKRPVKNYFD